MQLQHLHNIWSKVSFQFPNITSKYLHAVCHFMINLYALNSFDIRDLTLNTSTFDLSPALSLHFDT